MRTAFTHVLAVAAGTLTLAGVASGGSALAARLTTIYSFCAQPNCADGAYPVGDLIRVGGVLYGTTASGGANNEGTAFSITPLGVETVLHSFGHGSGRRPLAGLVNVGGTLYGTTDYGGTNNSRNESGTVFSMGRKGHETVLHSFGSIGDGRGLYAGLINVGGTLYGTTVAGGAYSNSAYYGGTVFSITPQGVETVLHSFGSGSDGDRPQAGLVNVGGTLYGTTTGGGPQDAGMVFSIGRAGHETVLHVFVGIDDGAYPQADLVNVGGTLYGTTLDGGGAQYAGTVFSITLQGVETVLHSFGNTAGDGAYPQGGLVYAGGMLYGTTAFGGVNNEGTVFLITPHGVERVLYSFGSAVGDGVEPYGDLLNVCGTLYGITSAGGANNGGTVFSITP